MSTRRVRWSSTHDTLSLVEDEGSGQSGNLEPTLVLPEALSP